MQLTDEERARIQQHDCIRYRVGVQELACADVAQVRQDPKENQLELPD